MAAQGQPAPFDIDVLPDAIHRIHTFIDSDGTDEDVSGWILGNDFVDFVSAVLSSSYVEDEIESIGGFLSHLASLAAHYVSSAEPLAHIFGAHQLLSKLFLCEDDCKFFLSTYGAVAQKTTEALEVNGHHAIVPPSGASKYFVAVFNKFCDEHGFEHVLRRLSQFLDDMTEDTKKESWGEIALYVNIVYEARFVLAKRFVFTTWQSFHTLITALCDAHAVTFTPTNELVGQTLFRLDVIGRFVLRAYFVQWQWDSLSDVATSYHMNHALLMLADEDTRNVVRAAVFINNFLQWILRQALFRKLEATWAVSDWLVGNSIVEALSAALLDPSLAPSHQKCLTQAATVVAKFHEKIPPRSITEGGRPRHVRLLLKQAPDLPSHGVLTMLTDGNSTTIRNVYEYCSSVLCHPMSSLHVTTQAGKHVMLDAHGDWAVSSVSQICTLNVMIAARNTPTEASAPYPHASEDLVVPSGVQIKSLFGTPLPSELKGFMASLGRDSTDIASIAEVVGGSQPTPPSTSQYTVVDAGVMMPQSSAL